MIAEQACVCAVLTRQSLHDHIAAEPAFAFELIGRVIRRARLATQSARSMALLDVYGRLVQLLESLAVVQADGSRIVAERLTHAEIAARIGCSREMISRLLKSLTSGGYVQQRTGRLALRRTLPAAW